MIKEYKEWFSNLGEKTPIIEKQYKSNDYFFEDKKKRFLIYYFGKTSHC